MAEKDTAEISKAKPNRQVATLLKNVGNKVEDMSLKSAFDGRSIYREDVMSETVKAWHREIDRNLKHVSSRPKVSKSAFRDAKKLFGANCDIKVTLRKPWHLGAYEEIVLPQFDPNFMSTEVVCRHPSCNNENPAAAKCGKRDLYLCPNHQQVLRNSISDALAKKNIQISTSAEKSEKPQPGHFAGYISLISLLDGAYQDAKKFHTLKKKFPMVEEAILNVRNFLIITSTVLNPDEDNLGIALPPVVQILLQVLRANLQSVLGLFNVLREVIEMILFAFGVIYTWVSLALGSPGTQMGAGVGACIGAIAFLLGPWTGAAGLAAGLAAGGTIGGLIGSGIYNLKKEQSLQQEMNRFREHWGNAGGQPNNQYPVYHSNGDAFGGLDLFLEVL